MTNFVMKYNVMNELGKFLRERRKELELKIAEVARLCRIDQALISKYEGGNRMPSEKHLRILAEGYDVEYIELRKLWVVEKVVSLVYDEYEASDILFAAETRIEYLSKNESLEVPKLSKAIKDKLKKVDELSRKWNDLKPFDGIQLAKMNEYFNIQYTHQSNQIEGNTLSLQETMLVVSKGLTISGKSVKEHLEAINHSEAISYIGDMINGTLDFSRRVLMDIHSLILRSIDQKNAGRLRDVPVRITGSEHVPPLPHLLEKLMEDYFLFYQRNKKILHPVIMAAELHERLVSIHPFIDGNGRTSRLVMNFYLLKNGYTVTSLKGDRASRLEYYRALEECHIDNKYERFYNLIIDRLIFSLEEHLSMI